MTNRRSIWSDAFEQAPETGTNIAGDAPTLPALDPVHPPKPDTILAQLRTAEPKKQQERNRTWEREHPNKTYRRSHTRYETKSKRSRVGRDIRLRGLRKPFWSMP